MKLKLNYIDEPWITANHHRPVITLHDTTHASHDFPNGVFLVGEKYRSALILLRDAIDKELVRERSNS